MISELNLVRYEVNWWFKIGVYICNDRNLFNPYEIVNGMNIYMRNFTRSSVNDKKERLR